MWLHVHEHAQWWDVWIYWGVVLVIHALGIVATCHPEAKLLITTVFKAAPSPCQSPLQRVL